MKEGVITDTEVPPPGTHSKLEENSGCPGLGGALSPSAGLRVPRSLPKTLSLLYFHANPRL